MFEIMLVGVSATGKTALIRALLHIMLRLSQVRQREGDVSPMRAALYEKGPDGWEEIEMGNDDPIQPNEYYIQRTFRLAFLPAGRNPDFVQQVNSRRFIIVTG